MRKKEKYLKSKIVLMLGLFALLYFLVQHNQQLKVQYGLPDSFDLRQVDGFSYVSARRGERVGYQWWNNIELSWAHAALDTLESNLLKQAILVQPDQTKNRFSSWYLGTKNGYNNPIYSYSHEPNPLSNPTVPMGYNSKPNEKGWGGNLFYAVDFLANQSGVVPDKAAPWPTDAINARRPLSPPDDLSHRNYMLNEALIYSQKNYKSILFYHAAIKKAIMTHGAVATEIYIGQGDWPGQQGESFWRDQNYHEYFCDRALLAGRANHAVTVVGWDEEKEITGAPGVGAWLVKDSYGTNWHESGFFWVSYYDRVFLNSDSYAVQFIGEVATQYDWPRYQTAPRALSLTLDEEGRDQWRYLSDGFSEQKADIWGAARFTAKENTHLKAVGLMTLNPDEEINLFLFSRWSEENHQPEDLLFSQELKVETPGYHVLELSQQLPLWKNQEFVVVVRFAMQADANHEPLVVVSELGVDYSQNVTYRNSYSPELGFGVWEDYATIDPLVSKRFFLQVLTGD